MEMSIRFPHLNLGFDYVGRSVQIFGFEITIYGVLIAVGMLLGMAFVVLEAKRSNQDQDRYLNMMIVSLIASVVGARLYYVVFSWTLYKENLMTIFDLRSGGSAFYGGLLGGVIAAAVYCRICKLSFWKMADTASMGILIGQIIGRWGDFFNRESFGEYTDGIFAMQLPLSAVRSGEVTAAMRENLITEGGISFVQVSPVFLYESLWCLLLLLCFLVIRRRKKFQGELFMRYLAGYGFGRFFFEWLRTDKLFIPGTRIGAAMVISALLFIVFAPTVWVRCIMCKKRAVARKLRREKAYEAEERAYQESEKAGTFKSEQIDELLQGMEHPPVSPKTTEVPKKTEEKVQSEPTVTEEKQEAQMQEQTEDSDNWENSEYAHIDDTWKTAAKSGEDASQTSNPFSPEAFERPDKNA